MTTPIPSFIQLPLDTGNTGKKRRTQYKIVGANTVHEDFVIVTSKRDILGTYKYFLTPTSISTTAHTGTSTGLLWMVNPIANTRKIAIKKLITSILFSANAVDVVMGVLRAQRFTYTGTPSGTTIVGGRPSTTDAAALGVLYTASTGMTITLGDVVENKALPVQFSAVASAVPMAPIVIDMAADDEVQEILLAPGEGLVIFSPIALTTANRYASIQLTTQEYD